jgi:hypothetical protein
VVARYTGAHGEDIETGVGKCCIAPVPVGIIEFMRIDALLEVKESLLNASGMLAVTGTPDNDELLIVGTFTDR